MPKVCAVAPPLPPVVEQLLAAGLYPYFLDCDLTEDGSAIRGTIRLHVVHLLATDGRFLRGHLHHLHDEVGTPRTEWRSLNGSLGPGSLQIVLNAQTGQCYVDVDRYNPYHDLVRFVGHTGEVLRGWWRRIRPGPAKGDRA